MKFCKVITETALSRAAPSQAEVKGWEELHRPFWEKWAPWAALTLIPSPVPGAAAICTNFWREEALGSGRGWSRACQEPPAKASKRGTLRERKAKSCPATTTLKGGQGCLVVTCPTLVLHNRRSQQPPVSVAPRVRSPLGTYFASHIINTLSDLLKQARRQNECKHRHKTTDMWTNTWQSEDRNLPRVILKSPWLSKTSLAFLSLVYQRLRAAANTVSKLKPQVPAISYPSKHFPWFY